MERKEKEKDCVGRECLMSGVLRCGKVKGRWV